MTTKKKSIQKLTRKIEITKIKDTDIKYLISSFVQVVRANNTQKIPFTYF